MKISASGTLEKRDIIDYLELLFQIQVRRLLLCVVSFLIPITVVAFLMGDGTYVVFSLLFFAIAASSRNTAWLASNHPTYRRLLQEKNVQTITVSPQKITKESAGVTTSVESDSKAMYLLNTNCLILLLAGSRTPVMNLPRRFFSSKEWDALTVQVKDTFKPLEINTRLRWIQYFTCFAISVLLVLGASK